MKKFLFPISIITTLFILVACVADNNIKQPATNEITLNNETTVTEENITQDNIISEQESASQETVTENQSHEVTDTTKEQTNSKPADAVVHTTQKNITQTTNSPEKTTKPNITTETTTAASVDIISKEEAKKIVLKHAGLSEDDIIRFSIELDREFTGTKYDIDFRTAEHEYEYELEAKNGKIIKSEKEAEKILKPQPTPENTTVPTEATTKAPETTTTAPETTTASASDSLITKQQAKEIALKHAKVNEADIRGYEIELDRELGKTVYEISFDSGNFEYEYEINATNGSIINSKKEAEITTRPQPVPEITTKAPETTTAPASESLITKQRAKEIALTHAGVNEANIRGYEIELDRELGKTVYEISFDSGDFEFEYKINAKNGSIINSEKEHND